MDARTNLTAKLASRDPTEGPARAPMARMTEPASAANRPGNAAPHPPAAARAPGIEHDLFNVANVFKRTPYIADSKPSGRYVAKDMFEVRSVPLLLRTLLDRGYLHGEYLTVTGRAVSGSLGQAKRNKDQDVVRPADKPLSASSGVVGLAGNQAPAGAVVKVAGMADLKFTGPARGFDGEEARCEAVKKKKYREGEVLVIRSEGPNGGPGMREMLATAARHGRGAASRLASAARGRCIGHLAPPADVGGPTAHIRDDDLISIDAVTGTLDLKLSKAEFDSGVKARKQACHADI